MTEPGVDSGEEKGGFLPQIESLRGVAAIAVAASHCGAVLLFMADQPVTLADRICRYLFLDATAWLLNGRAAVIVFFVISGLVLSLALDARPAHGGPGAYGRFTLRRALRIYPAHLVALALFVPLAHWSLFRLPVVDPTALGAAKDILKPWIDGFVYGHIVPQEIARTAILYDNYYNPVVWTLQVEVLASLLLPFLAAWSRRGTLLRDLGALLVLGAAAAVLVDAEKRPDLFLLYLPAFYLGCTARTHGRRLVQTFSRVRGGPRLALGASLLLLLVPATALTPDRHVLLAICLMSAGAFGLVSTVAWADPRRTFRLLLHPRARWAGRISYSFYLWHDLALFAFVRLLLVLLPPRSLAGNSLVILGLTFAVTFAAAAFAASLSYAWIERPLIRIGVRRFVQLPGPRRRGAAS